MKQAKDPALTELPFYKGEKDKQTKNHRRTKAKHTKSGLSAVDKNRGWKGGGWTCRFQ